MRDVREQSKMKIYAALVLAIVLSGCMALTACSSTTSGSASGSGSSVSSASADGSSSASSASSSSPEGKADTSYASLLFDTSYVHTVDITISEADWADLKQNPLEKTKYKVDITIDGETVSEASFATKGNTSLSSVASDGDSDRYSFKVNFGKYIDDQTYHGLNKLNLNNAYADATYMKDYISYAIFRAAGVNAPLASYVQLKVNGEDLGLYLAVEEVEESYLDRAYDGEGELYKPETEMLGNMDKMGEGGKGPQSFGNGGQAPQGFNGGSASAASPNSDSTASAASSQSAQSSGSASGDSATSAESSMGSRGFPGGMEPPEGMELSEGMEMPGGFGGFGSGDAGATLKYTDDEISSYPDIFDNAETKVDEADEQRVVAALKQLSEGNVESSVDTDEVIRFFAAHNFVISYDSYTGSMLHNYYLYENDGKLSMIPWDYNLAFGGFGTGGGFSAGGGQGGMFGGGMFGGGRNRSADSNSSAAPSGSAPSASSAAAAPTDGAPSDASSGSSRLSDATDAVNCGIDTPLSGAQESDRPMWAWITASDEYLERYHEVYNELLSSYFESGECRAEIELVRAMIAPYVERDASAFYTVDEFNTAVDTLEAFVDARAKSIRAQLDGTLSTKTSEQDASAKVDASGIDLSTMGSQGRGR